MELKVQKCFNLCSISRVIIIICANLTILFSEIVDGNVKMTLGMIWTIILRFAIQDISVEGEININITVNINIYMQVTNTQHKKHNCLKNVCIK